jgi:hypothetical protein
MGSSSWIKIREPETHSPTHAVTQLAQQRPDPDGGTVVGRLMVDGGLEGLSFTCSLCAEETLQKVRAFVAQNSGRYFALMIERRILQRIQ